MNKELIKERFTKAHETYTEEAVTQRAIALKMVSLLRRYPVGHNLLEIGCGTGIFSRLLIQEKVFRKILLNDICPEMEFCLGDILNESVRFQPGDAENFPFSNQWDLIASCSAIQWFSDPASFFKRCHSLLSPAGYLAFSTFGADNMKEIASITGSGLSYPGMEELKRMLMPDYEILYAGEENIIQTFLSPVEVLYHLKRTGVTGISSRVWAKGDLAGFCREYLKRFSSGGRVSLTYQPIYLIAQKK